MRHAFLPAVVSTSGRIHGELLRLLYIPTRRLSFTSRPLVRPSMSTLRLTAGGGAGFSEACGLPLA